MKKVLRSLGVLTLALFLLAMIQPIVLSAASVSQLKKDVEFVNANLKRRLKIIRSQLRKKKYDLATKNINTTVESLQRIARNTKKIRKEEPGYSPNPPIDFDRTPAAARMAQYKKAKKLAIEAGKKLNSNYMAANQALLKARERQIKTIAVSALKFTVENAPGQPGGKVSDLVVEGVKKLNSYLMDEYIAKPISGISEVKLLKNNFVTIRDGEKLLKRLDAAREEVLEVARRMDREVKKLQPVVQAEKRWQKYRWLSEPGVSKVTVKILDYKPRDFELTINGVKLKSSLKGKTLTIPTLVTLKARVKGKRAQFCLDKKEQAKKMKTIILHAGPGGGPSDSLVYSSSRIPAKSSWLIQKESFTWKPSSNTTIENAPAAVSGVYWKQEKARVLWDVPASPGEKFNLYVKGKITWEFTRNIRGKISKKKETNDGTATLVLEVVK